MNSAIKPNLQRRRFFKALGILPVFLSPLTLANVLKKKKGLGQEVWISAASQSAAPNEKVNGLAWFGAPTELVNSSYVSTEFRGHGLCFNPNHPNHALMMARRPGRHGVIVDVSKGKQVAEFVTQSPYEFQGHACYSADGRKIFTSEMFHDDTHPEKNGQGRIGIRDATNYEWIGELNSYGVEPHEIKLMPDGRTLVIANGGLAPEDNHHNKTPADVMASSLVFVDSVSGELIERCVVDEKKASVRHISISDDGTVVAALQVQRQVLNDTKARPLAVIKRPGEDLTYLHAPETVWLGAKDYMGSVALWQDRASSSSSAKGITVAGMTSPRGNFAVFWDVKSGRFLGYHALHDVCGIAISQINQSFVLTNSAGDIRFVDPISLQEHRHFRQKYQNTRWDNHLVVSVV